jgi:hypothetical protein
VERKFGGINTPRRPLPDRLAVTDVLNKLLVFDTEGEVVPETRIDPNFVILNPLENGFQQLKIFRMIWNYEMPWRPSPDIVKSSAQK